MQKVGKLNSSIDIIPLQGSSGDCKSKTMNHKHKVDPSQRYLRDQLLISRVKMYMYENENKIYIDVDEMARSLQKKYSEYRMKKRASFRDLVRRAYDELTEFYTKKDSSREWPVYDDDDDDDEEDEVDIESDSQNTMLGSMLLKMYKKSQSKQNGNSSDKELIDISSDDDVNKIDTNTIKKIKDSAPLESGLQQTPGPSLCTVKQVTSKEEVEQPKTPVRETPRITITEGSTRKRQRDKENDNNQFLHAKKAKGIPVTEPKFTFADVGGSDSVLKTVCKLLAHMKHPEIFKQLGIAPPRGFLLHGPPGCGKTLLAYAIAGELELPLLKVAAPELVAGVSGESEARIRELFEQAITIAPCVVFLDEIDAVAPHRATAQREMERRIVAQLLSCLDELSLKENGDRVLVIGATNRPDSLDPALRRAGRFDREVSLGIPDRNARAKILSVHTAKVALAPNVSLSTIASLTPGFVGADLVALIREAAMAAVDRIFENINKIVPGNKSSELNTIDDIEKTSQSFENSGNLIDESAPSETSASTQNDVSLSNKEVSEKLRSETEMDVIHESSKSPDLTNLLTWLHNEPPLSLKRLQNLSIEHSDFETALRIVQPSAKREGFATVPDVTWDDIGSLQDIRQELQMTILAPVRHSEHFVALGLTAATGVLLCGPPGCGKTLLAKAIANEAGINFISVKGPELLNMYVGESEKAVRQCFIRARNSAPCVIFFDELDALCPRRSDGDNSATSRVVNQMLTEMDGVEGRQGVFLMAASNRPDIIDPAVLRPGRLDKILYVGLPTASDRVDILKALTKNATKPRLAPDINLEKIGYNTKCDGYTGADLAALIRESGMEALKEMMTCYTGQPEISMRHIEIAFDKVRPSVQEKDMKHYERLKKLYSVKKKSDDASMETPVNAPIVDVVMEPMET